MIKPIIFRLKANKDFRWSAVAGDHNVLFLCPAQELPGRMGGRVLA